MNDHKIEAAYLRINGTGYREGDVAKTIEVTPSLFVDLLADGRIAGIESLAGAIGATELLKVLHHIVALTPKAREVVDAAKRFRRTDLRVDGLTHGDGSAAWSEYADASDDFFAAVDRYEGTPT